jgi:transcription antitermination factor NusG
MPSKVWFAIYTRSRSEKRTHQSLISSGIESYLPLVRTLRQWSDRKKWVEEPLFRSYVFVHINPDEYFSVLNTNGVVRYVTFEGKAVPIPQKQVDAIRYFIDSGEEPVAPGDPLQPGAMVEVIRGPLHGLSGQLVDIKGKNKVRIQIDGLGQSVCITLPSSHLRKQ